MMLWVRILNRVEKSIRPAAAFNKKDLIVDGICLKYW